MKIALISDFHLHPFPQFATSEEGGVNSRLLDGINCLEQVADYIERNEDIKECIFAGDMFHVRNSINVATFNTIIESISKFNKRLLDSGCHFSLIPGNHDQHTKDGRTTALDVLHNLRSYGNIALYTSACVTNLTNDEQSKICYLPHTEHRENIKKYKNEECDLKIAHLGINGAIIGADFVYSNAADSDLDDLGLTKCGAVFMGHFHKHQQVAKNAWYIGSPLQHNMGDEGQVRGFMTYDLNTKEAVHVPLRYPSFVSMNDDNFEQKLELIENNYVRVKSSHVKKLKEQLQAQKVQPKAIQYLEEPAKKTVTYTASRGKFTSVEKSIQEYVDKLDTALDKGKIVDMAIRYMKHEQN